MHCDGTDVPPALTGSTIDHWAAHPEWAPGRRLLTVLLPFGAHPAVTDQVADLRAELTATGVVPCAVENLHQTIYSVGWEDERVPTRVAETLTALRHEFAHCRRFDLTLGPPEDGTEGIWLRVRPEAPLRMLQRAAHAAMGRTDPVADLFGHVAIAYTSSAGPTHPLRAFTDRHRDLEIGQIPVQSVDAVWLSRSATGYAWDLIGRLPIGSDP